MDEKTAELCRRASTETDREKLLELVSQITESIDQENKATPKENDGSSP